ncbi:myosin phosphatase Rho-interacting protein-like, partial [Equus quagga]|uniref:myosin phosphatase Rho-interacting protein-like n=1 Tax=Equus quagga TaxID=89248 RepID=UPI001EE1DC42
AKPIYGGWLLLAPDGTDLDNPVHRSRKWQWRFFILYKHSLLRYALDEMGWRGLLLTPTGSRPGMLLNMLQCTGQPLTTQKDPAPNDSSAKAENPA